MKVASLGQNLHEFHEKCACQICTCQKHHCPYSHIHIPHTEISSYQNEYIKHPINTWGKPPSEKAKPYTPYDYINSAYREHYPGHKPQMREKLVPRVKDEKKEVPFNSTSEYFKQYGPKSVPKPNVYIKDNQYNPDRMPFNPTTSYKSDFYPKQPNPHDKNRPDDVKYPDGYKFNPSTTYNNDFFEKQSRPQKNYKPEERVAQKGPHDLTTIYKQDFNQKPPIPICPVLKMPTLPSSISYPSQHLSYNKFSGTWQPK